MSAEELFRSDAERLRGPLVKAIGQLHADAARTLQIIKLVERQLGRPIKCIGFTGTLEGMTLRQRDRLDDILRVARQHGAETFRHGDCEGAEVVADEMAACWSYQIIIHPSDNLRTRANCHLKDDAYPRLVLPPKPYMNRNWDIVDRSCVLITAPRDEQDFRRFNTWATVRRARETGKPIFLLLPDGRANLKNLK